MEDKLIELIYGSALHDIGKVVQRATNQKINHSTLGGDFMSKIIKNPAIEHQIRYHHSKELQKTTLLKNDLAYITYIADNIASATDRKTKDENTQSNYFNWDTHTNQEDIFNHFKSMNEERYYKPVMLDDRTEINFASLSYKKFSSSDYQSIVNKLEENLKIMEFKEEYINSLLDLLESTLSYVPSSTNLDEAKDISLYDHVKLTTALASSIYYYLVENNIEDYRDTLFKKSVEFYNQPVFQLLKFDISGVQNFIYTIRDKKAATMLRSRSFYLEILAENLIDEMLNNLGLSRANVLYSGGGGAYLLLPNTSEINKKLKLVEAEINTFLRTTFGSELYIAFGKAMFTANQAMSKDKTTTFGDIYNQVSQSISAKKLNRYTADEIRFLNQKGKIDGRECNVCHTIHENEEEICSLCSGLIQFSKKLQFDDFYQTCYEKSPLSLGFGRFLHSVSKAGIAIGPNEQRVYAKNKFYIGSKQSIHLWVGDYVDEQRLTFNEFAENSQGIKRLAVLRCDVDDLGQAFINGFSNHFNTLSRSATFSRTMSLFFKYYINLILKELNSKAQIIYSGGDDVFVVGDWLDIVKFSIELRQKFIQYTQGKLTLSSGIGMFPAKTPVSIMAIQTGHLEAKAKDNGKDSITLFNEANTFKWDVFINEIWNEKLQLIMQFFESNQFEDTYGKAFIYRLLELIRQSFNESRDNRVLRGQYKTISWAQWAYFLTRMEPKEPVKKHAFKEFTRQLHTYFEDGEQAKQLAMALELYVYTIRGE